MRKLLVVTLVGSVLLLGMSCKSNDGDNGYVLSPTGEYSWGSLTKSFDQPVPQVANAVRDAFQQMNIRLIDQRVSDVTSHFDGRTSNDTKVNVDINRSGENVSKVKIGWGTLGNEDNSRALMRIINQNLGTTATPGTTTR